MAKAAKDVNKAGEIRKILEAHPETKGVEVVEMLAKRGIKVAPAQVSNVKVALEKKKGGGKKAKAKAGSSAGGDVAATIKAAAALIKTAGGVDAAKKVVDALGQSNLPF